MANKKTARRALFSSVLALILCCCMLVGTTFAWFTDEVVSSGNIIKSGTLDAGLYYGDAANDISNDASTGTIFNYDLWEPGYTMVKYVKITNEGNLAYKFRLDIIPNVAPVDGKANLADVIDVYMFDPTATVDRAAIAAATPVGTLSDLMTDADGAAYGVLLPAIGSGHSTNVNTDDAPKGEIIYCIALKMQETAGNEYQNLSVGGGFKVRLMATQYTWEKDSFDHNYDTEALYNGNAVAEVPAAGVSAIEIDVTNVKGNKIGSFVIPAAAIADDAEKIEVKVEETPLSNNITLAADQKALPFEVTVTGLREGNTVPVKVTLYAPLGLDPATVKLYHYDDPIDCTYNPTTGYVTFESETFSPFTIVYDAESKYEAPDVTPDDLPEANVSSYTPPEDIVWGNYGQWSPNKEVDADPKLEAAYTFSCTENLDEAKLNPYANWNCDFYVKLDRDLGANQIFLGGNYGSFGWVGFHNGDLALAANEEVALLGSVTSNPWTYVDVVQNVGTFICGVGDVDDALSGATFTVMLRLTNPEDATEFFNIETINYTFD